MRRNTFIKRVSIMLLAAFLCQDVARAGALEVRPPSDLASNPSLLHLPSSYAEIHEIHKGTRPRLLIHIQDAHTNVSGQENLARTLEELVTRYKVKTVFVEGGTENNTLSFLRPLAPAGIRKQIAKKYLLKGELNGEEYLSLASDHDFELWGVEERALYQQNLKEYADVFKKREEVLAYLDTIRQRVQSLKRRFYEKDAAAFDEAVEKFEQKEKDFTDYHAVLTAAAAKNGISMNAFPNFASLVSLKEKEAKVDFEAANREQADLVHASLEGDDASEAFTSKLEKIRSSTQPMLSFYESLIETARKKSIPEDSYRNLLLYTDYLKAYAHVDMAAFLEETQRLQEEVFARSLKDPNAMYLHAIDAHLKTMKTLFSLQASKEIYETYRARKNDARFDTVAFLAFINRKLYDMGNYADVVRYQPLLDENVVRVENFYDTTERRDEAFVTKAFRKMDEQNASVAVIVTGGYHTSNLTRLLKSSGVSYAVVTPVVTQETNLKRYEEILLAQLGSGNPILKKFVSREGERATALRFTALERQRHAAAGQGPLVPISQELAQLGGTTDRLNQIAGSLSQARPAVPALAAARLATEFKSVEIPEAYAPALNRSPYNLRAEKIEILQLRGDQDAYKSVLSRTENAFAASASVAQALGSILYAGQGKDVKEVADGNAVHFTERSIQAFTEANLKAAIVIKADEGARDESYSLRVGSIYYHGKEIQFSGITQLKVKLAELAAQGVQIYEFVGDALEKTNGLVVPEAVTEATDSTAVFGLFKQTSQTQLNGTDSFLINDNFRVGGVSFHSDSDAGVTPFDLPSVALKKIGAAEARTAGLAAGSPQEEEFIRNFINSVTVLTLGPRSGDLLKEYEKTAGGHRHAAIIADAQALQKDYPGLKIVLPSDGDFAPRAVASLGVDLDGRRLIVFGRSGSAEATASTIIALDDPKAQFPHSFVSANATNRNYSQETAYRYDQDELGYYSDLGISPSVFTKPRTKSDLKGSGILAVTSVTGASAGMYGPTFADIFSKVKVEPAGDIEGLITTNTLLVTPEGSFIIRTSLRTDDLKATKDGLLTASHAAREYRDRSASGARLAAAPRPKYAEKLLEGVGERKPDWQRLNILAALFLKASGDTLSLGTLLTQASEAFNNYQLSDTENNIQRLLDRMVSLELLRKVEGGAYQLAVSKRLLAVKMAGTEFVKDDIQARLDAVKRKDAGAEQALLDTVNEYANIAAIWHLSPTEARWPVLQAVSFLAPEDQKVLESLLDKSPADLRKRTLVDSILLMLQPEPPADWLEKNAPQLVGRTVYYVSPEIWLVAGGLGRVSQYHSIGMKKLVGDKAAVATIEPYYPKRVTHEGKLEDVDYSKLPVPVQGLQPNESPAMTFTVNVSGKNVTAQVYQGTNEYGMTVYLIKDSEDFYTKLLYRYGPQFGTANWQSFSEFFSKASLELMQRLEAQKRTEKGAAYKSPVIIPNDGQLGPLPILKRMGDESAEPQKRSLIGAFVWYVTHTVNNRNGGMGQDTLQSSGILPRLWRYFMRLFNQVDPTSAGRRAADMTSHVSTAHGEDVNPIDPGVRGLAVTNGDHREASSRVFREILARLFGASADPEHPTAEQVAAIKREAKTMVAANPLLTKLNPLIAKIKSTQMLLGYFGRLVTEKAARTRAFDDSNIRAMVIEDGTNVLQAANVQSHTQYMQDEMTELARSLNIYEPLFEMGLVKGVSNWKDLGPDQRHRRVQDVERKLVQLFENTDGKNADDVRGMAGKYLGLKSQREIIDLMERAGLLEKPAADAMNDLDAFFEKNNRGYYIPMTGWSQPEQIAMLAATDVQVQDSDRGTEAAGYSESDISANGGLQVGPPGLEGILQKQGLIIDQSRKSSGNTMVPVDERPESYREVFRHLSQLYKADQNSASPDFGKFSSYQAESVPLSRPLTALLPSADYLRESAKGVASKEDPIRTLLDALTGDGWSQDRLYGEWYRKDLVATLEKLASTSGSGVYRFSNTSNPDLHVYFMTDLDGNKRIINVDTGMRNGIDVQTNGKLIDQGLFKLIGDGFGVGDEGRLSISEGSTVYGEYPVKQLREKGLGIIVRGSGVQVLDINKASGARLVPGAESENLQAEAVKRPSLANAPPVSAARLSVTPTPIPDAPVAPFLDLISKVYMPSLTGDASALTKLAIPAFPHPVYTEDIPAPTPLRSLVNDASGNIREDLKNEFLLNGLERTVAFELMAGAAQRYAVMVGGQAKGTMTLKNMLDLKPALTSMRDAYAEINAKLAADSASVPAADITAALTKKFDTAFVKPDYEHPSQTKTYTSTAALGDFGGIGATDIQKFISNYKIIQELLASAEAVEAFIAARRQASDANVDAYLNLSLGSMHVAAQAIAIRTLAAERYELEQKNNGAASNAADKAAYVDAFMQTKAQAILNVNDETAGPVLEDLKAWNFFGFNPERIVFVLSPNIPVVVKDPKDSSKYTFMTDDVAAQMGAQPMRHPYGHAFILPLLYFPDSAFRYNPATNALEPLGKPAMAYMIDDLKAWNFVQRNIDDLGGVSPDSVLPPGLLLLSDPEFVKKGYNGVAEVTINATGQPGGGHILEKRGDVVGPVVRIMEDKELKNLKAALTAQFPEKTSDDIDAMVARALAAGPWRYLNRMQFVFDARMMPKADGTADELLKHLNHAVWTTKKTSFGEYGIFEAFFSTVLTETLNLMVGFDGSDAANIPINPAVKSPLHAAKIGDDPGFVGRSLQNYGDPAFAEFVSSHVPAYFKSGARLASSEQLFREYADTAKLIAQNLNALPEFRIEVAVESERQRLRAERITSELSEEQMLRRYAEILREALEAPESRFARSPIAGDQGIYVPKTAGPQVPGGGVPAIAVSMSPKPTAIPEAPDAPFMNLISRVYMPSLGDSAKLTKLAIPDFSHAVYTQNIPQPVPLRALVMDPRTHDVRADLKEEFLKNGLPHMVVLDLMAGAAQRFAVMVGGQAKGTMTLKNVLDIKPTLERLRDEHRQMFEALSTNQQLYPEPRLNKDKLPEEDTPVTLAINKKFATDFEKPNYANPFETKPYVSTAALADFGGSGDTFAQRFLSNYKILQELIDASNAVETFVAGRRAVDDPNTEAYLGLSLASMHVAAQVIQLRALAGERYELEQKEAKRPSNKDEKAAYVAKFVAESGQAIVNVNDETAGPVLEELKAWRFFGLNPDRVPFVLSPNIPVIVKNPDNPSEYTFMTEAVAQKMNRPQIRHPYGHAFILPLLYFPESAFRYNPATNALEPLGKPAMAYMIDDLKAWNFVQRNIDDLGGVTPKSVFPPGLLLLSDPEFLKQGYDGVAEVTLNPGQAGGGHILEQRPGVTGPVGRILEDKELKNLKTALKRMFPAAQPTQIDEMYDRVVAAGPGGYLNRMQFTFDARKMPKADGTADALLAHLTHAVYTEKPLAGDAARGVAPAQYGIFEAFFSTVLTETLNLAIGVDAEDAAGTPTNPAVKIALNTARVGAKEPGFVPTFIAAVSDPAVASTVSDFRPDYFKSRPASLAPLTNIDSARASDVEAFIGTTQDGQKYLIVRSKSSAAPGVIEGELRVPFDALPELNAAFADAKNFALVDPFKGVSQKFINGENVKYDTASRAAAIYFKLTPGTADASNYYLLSSRVEVGTADTYPRTAPLSGARLSVEEAKNAYVEKLRAYALYMKDFPQGLFSMNGGQIQEERRLNGELSAARESLATTIFNLRSVPPALIQREIELYFAEAGLNDFQRIAEAQSVARTLKTVLPKGARLAVSRDTTLAAFTAQRTEAGFHTFTGGQAHKGVDSATLAALARESINQGFVPALDDIEALRILRQQDEPGTNAPVAFFIAPQTLENLGVTAEEAAARAVSTGAHAIFTEAALLPAVAKAAHEANSQVVVFSEIGVENAAQQRLSVPDVQAAVASAKAAGADGVILKPYFRGPNNIITPAELRAIGEAQPDLHFMVAGGVFQARVSELLAGLPENMFAAVGVNEKTVAGLQRQLGEYKANLATGARLAVVPSTKILAEYATSAKDVAENPRIGELRIADALDNERRRLEQQKIKSDLPAETLLTRYADILRTALQSPQSKFQLAAGSSDLYVLRSNAPAAPNSDDASTIGARLATTLSTLPSGKTVSYSVSSTSAADVPSAPIYFYQATGSPSGGVVLRGYLLNDRTAVQAVRNSVSDVREGVPGPGPALFQPQNLDRSALNLVRERARAEQPSATAVPVRPVTATSQTVSGESAAALANARETAAALVERFPQVATLPVYKPQNVNFLNTVRPSTIYAELTDSSPGDTFVASAPVAAFYDTQFGYETTADLQPGALFTIQQLRNSGFKGELLVALTHEGPLSDKAAARITASLQSNQKALSNQVRFVLVTVPTGQKLAEALDENLHSRFAKIRIKGMSVGFEAGRSMDEVVGEGGLANLERAHIHVYAIKLPGKQETVSFTSVLVVATIRAGADFTIPSELRSSIQRTKEGGIVILLVNPTPVTPELEAYFFSRRFTESAA